ncbi:MAG: extracellular solute-binding protein, partial [Planctomycetota bacterium]|nr:extracellular solute-binding protein [Planctomycetota bacterium]
MKHAAGIIFALIASLPFVAMGWAKKPTEERGEVLRITSPHRREVRQEYSRAFCQWLREKHGREARIEWLDVGGGTSKIMKDLETRFKKHPEHPGVDLLFGGGVDPYLTASREGWLEKPQLPAEALAGIPAECAGLPVYDPEGRWFGVAMSGFGIIYDRKRVAALNLPEPSSWETLALPGYFGWLASGDPRSSGAVHMCYEIILQAYGWEKGWRLLARICANTRTFAEGGGTAPREVAAGEVAAGMAIDQYAQIVIAEYGDRLAFVLPSGATIVNPDAIGLIRNSPQRELATLFIAFALSPEGQRILFQPPGVNGQMRHLARAPVRPELYADPAAPRPNPYEFKGGFRYDSAKGGARWQVLNCLMGAWLIEPHALLRQAWQTVIARGCHENEVEELCRPALS